MEIKAKLNYLRISPRKVRLAANLIKGMDVERAELELLHLTKRSSEPLLKLIKSAVANAQHNFRIDEEALYVKNVLVNEGPKLKRYRPRAFGRAAPIRKRTSHISLILDTKEPVREREKGAKKSTLAVREAAPEEIKEEVDTRKERIVSPRGGEARLKQKPTGFVRKMFRRKAI